MIFFFLKKCTNYLFCHSPFLNSQKEFVALGSQNFGQRLRSGSELRFMVLLHGLFVVDNSQNDASSVPCPCVPTLSTIWKRARKQL